MISLLFSSAGRRVELIQCFRKTAQNLGIEAKFVAIDMDPEWSPACQVADHAVKVDRCTSDRYVNQVMEICDQYDINLIIPTIDTVLLVYVENKSLFADAGIQLHIGSDEFVRVARDKELTARLLGSHGIQVPQTWDYDGLINDKHSLNIRFPLIMKPKSGSCSKGIEIVSSLGELQAKIKGRDDYLLQEICTGREYTVNCFYDRRGACVSCVPHFRKFVRDGEVCFAQTERVQDFTTIAHQFSSIFDIWGCICFQGFKEKDGSVRVFEINARFGGGYPICDTAGGTFAKWILQDLIDDTPDYHDNWTDGLRMLRYDAAVYTHGEPSFDKDCSGH